MITNLRLRPLAFGLASFVPGVTRLFRRGTGGTSSARYCYSVWMRHLIRSHVGDKKPIPNVVAELGPGDSLGVGLAALLTGASRYYAFDFLQYASNLENLHVFDELVKLFSIRADIPDDHEFPLIRPRLTSYKFPFHIVDEKQLAETLSEDRLRHIRSCVARDSDQSDMITYMAPWVDSGVVQKNTVDMILSQAVLEHIDDLPKAYEAMHLWLKPSGIMSHAIDFKSHGLTKDWNGHWAQSDIAWWLLRGQRPYMINRQPYSLHIRLMQKVGFRIIVGERFESPSRIKESMIARPFGAMTNEDLTTSEAFVVAVPCLDA
jgi:hypothetical protein